MDVFLSSSSGGLSGSSAAPDWRAAGEGEQPADGPAVLSAPGRIPPPGGPYFHDTPAPLGNPRVQGWRLDAQQHCQQVLLQRNI